jgi:hypothetical protein
LSIFENRYLDHLSWEETWIVKNHPGRVQRLREYGIWHKKQEEGLKPQGATREANQHYKKRSW